MDAGQDKPACKSLKRGRSTRAERRSSQYHQHPARESWSCKVKSKGMQESPAPVSFSWGMNRGFKPSSGGQLYVLSIPETPATGGRRHQRRRPEESRETAKPGLRSPRRLYRSGSPRPGCPTWRRPAARPQAQSPILGWVWLAALVPRHSASLRPSPRPRTWLRLECHNLWDLCLII